MQSFKATLLKFADYGEKTGWTYISIPADIAEAIKPNNKKIFRVKGKLDDFAIEAVAVFPFGDGSFILPVNVTMRKGIKKKEGAMVEVKIEEDRKPLPISADLLECLNDEPKAKQKFESLSLSHKNYFSKWIEGAKTHETKAKRIAQSVNALAQGLDYPGMIRALKGKNPWWQ